MAKMTIEQLIKPVILADINTLLANENGQYTLKLVNDFYSQDKNDTRFTIAAIIKSGTGTRSNLSDVYAVNTPLTLMFRCEASYTQRLLQILNSYCQTTQTYIGTVTDAQEDIETEPAVTYNYQMFWNTAIPSGAKTSISVKVADNDNVKAESVDMTMVVLTGSITHSKDLPMDDQIVYFQVPINTGTGLWSAAGTLTYCELYSIDTNKISLTPALNTTQLVETYGPQVDVIGDTESFAYRFIRIKNDPVHDHFMRKLLSTRTSASFDINARFVMTTLSVSTTVATKITNITHERSGGYEYITISGVRL